MLRWRFGRLRLVSRVPGFWGPCKPVWINRNQVCNRMDRGVTGFFRLVKSVWYWPWPVRTGEEFHGMITEHGIIRSTAIDDVRRRNQLLNRRAEDRERGEEFTGYNDRVSRTLWEEREP